MNFLAHILLAGEEPAMMVGGVLGDFFKGPLPGHLPHNLALGVRLHRAIDVYTDQHPCFMASRNRVSSARRRYAGIMVDLFYDHFLARQWHRYTSHTLADYTQHFYECTPDFSPWLPSELLTMLERMRRHDWLASYQESAAIGRALDNIAQHRIRRENPLRGAGEELLTHYGAFEADFLAFFPELLRFAQHQRADLNTDGKMGASLG
ncbi:MAG: ACP phosphodiesterase [Aeromonadaceae bacterium]